MDLEFLSDYEKKELYLKMYHFFKDQQFDPAFPKNQGTELSIHTTDLEIQQIETDRYITDLEIAVLELQ